MELRHLLPRILLVRQTSPPAAGAGAEAEAEALEEVEVGEWREAGMGRPHGPEIIYCPEAGDAGADTAVKEYQGQGKASKFNFATIPNQ
jgi:hypothetical protein